MKSISRRGKHHPTTFIRFITYVIYSKSIFNIKTQYLISSFYGKINSYTDRVANKKFYDYPYGKKPHANKEEYLEIWDKAKSISYPEIDKLELQYGYAVSKEWIDELALLTQVVVKDSDICYQHGRVLYAVLSSYILKNSVKDCTIVETGTARGFSSLCMSKAISDMGSCGKIHTFDIIPNDKTMFWGCLVDHDGPRTRLELLEDYKDLLHKIIFIQGDTKILVKKYSTSRVNFAFIDAGHEYDNVVNDFNFIAGRQLKGDIIIFDDYSPEKFSGIVKAVDEICLKYKYITQIVKLSKTRGYCIAIKE